MALAMLESPFTMTMQPWVVWWRKLLRKWTSRYYSRLNMKDWNLIIPMVCRVIKLLIEKDIWKNFMPLSILVTLPPFLSHLCWLIPWLLSFFFVFNIRGTQRQGWQLLCFGNIRFLLTSVKSCDLNQPTQSLQDFARVFPPEYPSEEARGRKGITLYQLLRPELVKSNPVPLSSGNLLLNICLIAFIDLLLLLKMHFLHGLAQHLIDLRTIGRLQQPLNDYSRYSILPQ